MAGPRSTRRIPEALRRGDDVAVLAPASGVGDAEALERGLARIKAWGLQPRLMGHARERRDWPEGCPVAATDAERASDLQEALGDPRYRAVFCARGGYGSARLLSTLDFTPLAEDPKPILGYSDITALLAAAYARTGVIGFHGPMVATTEAMDAGDAGWALQRALLTDGQCPAALPSTDAPRGLRGGTAEGPLVGGNLSLVQCLVGTPWEIDTRGALLFLEDTGEVPYRVDRMLTHLLDTGAFARASGVLLGDFHVRGTALASAHPGMLRVLEDRLGGLGIPVARGFPIGHLPGAWTLPFGGRARLDVSGVTGTATLRLLEPSVRA